MAEFENRLACVITADGKIDRGYLVDKCEPGGTNSYTISWKIPLQGEAKTDFSGTIGSAKDEPVSPGLITVGLGQAPNELRVHTFDPAGTPALRSFPHHLLP
jgi:hypothetical protein